MNIIMNEIIIYNIYSNIKYYDISNRNLISHISVSFSIYLQ